MEIQNHDGRKKIWVWSKLYYLWLKAIIKLTEQKQNNHNNKKQEMVLEHKHQTNCLIIS